MPNDPYIVVGYHNIEADFAIQLATDLKCRRVQIEFDRFDAYPDHRWYQSQEQSVVKASALLAILSPDYVASGYGINELKYAHQHNIPIIAIVLREIALNDWPYQYIGYDQRLEFAEWQNPAIYERNLEQLINQIVSQTPVAVHNFDNPEVRYLTRLIGEIEADKDHFEPVLISYQTSNTTLESQRTPPRINATWNLNRQISILNDSFDPVERCTSLEQLIESSGCLVLLGMQGTGKTTILNRLVRRQIDLFRSDSRIKTLPLKLDLSEWEDTVSWADFVINHWPFNSNPFLRMAAGELSVFIDGLEQINGHQVEQLREWLTSKDAPRSALITCRLEAYDSDHFLPLAMVQLDPLNKSQIQEFIAHYLGPQAEAFLNKLNWEALPTPLTPLYLRLLIFIYLHSPNAPLVYHYDEIWYRYLIARWEREQILQNPYWEATEDMLFALSRLGLYMYNNGYISAIPHALLKEAISSETLSYALCNAQFLRLYRGYVRFTHPLLQAYITAYHFDMDDFHVVLEQPRFDVNGRRFKNAWDDVLQIEVRLTKSPIGMLNAISEVDPFLALDCLANYSEARPFLIRQIVLRAIQYIEYHPPLTPHLVAQHLLNALKEPVIPIILDIMRQEKWPLRVLATRILLAMDLDNSLSIADVYARLTGAQDMVLARELRDMGEEVLPIILQMMKDEVGQAYQTHIWALGAVSDAAAVPVLVQALQNHDALIRHEAALSLGRIRDVDAIPHLLTSLYDDDPNVRKSTAHALSQFGVSVIPPLVRMLRDDRDYIRRLAAGVLGRISNPVVIQELVNCLRDESPDVRATAVFALGRTQDDSAAGSIRQLLHDQAKPSWIDKSIATLAHEALQYMGLSTEPETRTEEDPSMGASARKARDKLKNLTTSHSQPVSLKDRLSAPEVSIRAQAVRELGKLNNSKALDVLVRRMRRDSVPQVRWEVASVLPNYRHHEAALNALLAMLDDPEPSVAGRAVDSLILLGDFVLQPLAQRLQSPNPNLRAHVVDALGRLGDPAAIPILEQLQHDQDVPLGETRSIASMAQEAILKLASKSEPIPFDPIGFEVADVLEDEDFADKTKKLMHDQVASPFNSHQDELLTGFGQPIEEAPPVIETLETEYDQETWGPLLDLLEQLNLSNTVSYNRASKKLLEMVKSYKGHPDQADILNLLRAHLSVQGQSLGVKFPILEAMGWIADASCIPVLVQLLEDSNHLIVINALRVLCEIHDIRVIPDILPLLHNKHPFVRQVAAEVLGMFRHESALEALLAVLHDAEDNVVRSVIDSLGAIGDVKAVNELIDMLSNPRGDIRWTTVKALGQIGAPKARKHVTKLLEDTYTPEWDYLKKRSVGDMARMALQRIGTSGALNISS
ncbi:hypothetical protein MASR2M15_16160 [Anaerolineales bacterium]